MQLPVEILFLIAYFVHNPVFALIDKNLNEVWKAFVKPNEKKLLGFCETKDVRTLNPKNKEIFGREHFFACFENSFDVPIKLFFTPKQKDEHFFRARWIGRQDEEIWGIKRSFHAAFYFGLGECQDSLCLLDNYPFRNRDWYVVGRYFREKKNIIEAFQKLIKMDCTDFYLVMRILGRIEDFQNAMEILWTSRACGIREDRWMILASCFSDGLKNKEANEKFEEVIKQSFGETSFSRFKEAGEFYRFSQETLEMIELFF